MIREFADLEIVALPALAAARLSADREAGFTKKWLVPSIDVASEFSELVDRKVRDAQSSLSVRYMQPTTPFAAGHFVEPPRRRQAEQFLEVLVDGILKSATRAVRHVRALARRSRRSPTWISLSEPTSKLDPEFEGHCKAGRAPARRDMISELLFNELDVQNTVQSFNEFPCSKWMFFSESESLTWFVNSHTSRLCSKLSCKL